MLQIKSFIALLTLCSITALSPAFGQTSSNPITVTTDKTSYSDGNTIIISGIVSNQLNVPISIMIKDPSQNIVYIGQINPKSDNTYSTQAVAGGSLWTSTGTYEIDVTYASKDNTAKTTFNFTPTIGQPTSSSVGNQINSTAAIPEFGTLAVSMFTISTLAVVFLYSRSRHFFKF